MNYDAFIRRIIPGFYIPETRVPDISEASPDNPIPLKGGVYTTDPRLDRVPEFDSRSLDYPAVTEEMVEESPMMAAEEKPKEYKFQSYTWEIPQHLDQGSEGSCVGFGWAHELIARPKQVTGVDYHFARWVYKTAQKYDYWSGESYEGTSVIAGAKVLQQRPPRMNEGRGLMDEYRWNFGDLDEARRTIRYWGPAIMGTWWKYGMFETDSEGYIRATGYDAGGHCYTIKGVSERRKAFRVHNSWGANWGEGGDAWLSFDDWQLLMEQDGEMCVPVRRRMVS